MESSGDDGSSAQPGDGEQAGVVASDRTPNESVMTLSEGDEAARTIRDALAVAIDGASPAVRQFQAELCDSGALRQLFNLAVARRPLAFEALRLLAYRNRIVVQQLANMGAIELLEQVLVREARSGSAGGEVQAAALQLLTSLLAFNLEIHSLVMRTKLVKRLVQLCRPGVSGQADWQPPQPQANGHAHDGHGHSNGQSTEGGGHSAGSNGASSTASVRTSTANGSALPSGPEPPGPREPRPAASANGSWAAATGSDHGLPVIAAVAGTVARWSGPGSELHPSPKGPVATSPVGAANPDAPVILSEEQQSMAACAAVALRNLCHQIANHPGLLAAGAALELATVMQREPDPYRRINATMAVALLVGHEEQHPLMRMDETGIREMLMVLACSRAKVMCHGYFWTCWKVCQALARLSANEDNKQVLTREGGVEVLADVLLSAEHSRKAITVKYCVEALWNLAFYEPARQQILANPALVNAIRTARQSGLDLVREVAEGCLFTLSYTDTGVLSKMSMPRRVDSDDPHVNGHQYCRGVVEGTGGAGSGQGPHPHHPQGARGQLQDPEELTRVVDGPVSPRSYDRLATASSVPLPHSASSIHLIARGDGGGDGGGADRDVLPPRGGSHGSHPAASASPAAQMGMQMGTCTMDTAYGSVPSGPGWHAPPPGALSARQLQPAGASEGAAPSGPWPDGFPHRPLHPGHQQHPAGDRPVGILHRCNSCASAPNRAGGPPGAQSHPQHAQQHQGAPDSPSIYSQSHGHGPAHGHGHARVHWQGQGPGPGQRASQAGYCQGPSQQVHPPVRGSTSTMDLGGHANGNPDGGGGHGGHGGVGGGGGSECDHIMISYEWGSQQKALMIKEALERRGLRTWMDVEKMSGSTLEAMALAVEGAAAVLLCITKHYKESQACRAEAEYAFQQRKRIIPIMMERGYRPTGWLGILVGTKLYFDFSERRLINERVAALERELGPLARQCRRSTNALQRSRASSVLVAPSPTPSQMSHHHHQHHPHPHSHHQQQHQHQHQHSHLQHQQQQQQQMQNGGSSHYASSLYGGSQYGSSHFQHAHGGQGHGHHGRSSNAAGQGGGGGGGGSGGQGRPAAAANSTEQRSELPSPAPSWQQSQHRHSNRTRRGSAASYVLPEVPYDIAAPLQSCGSMKSRDSGVNGGGSVLSSVEEAADGQGLPGSDARRAGGGGGGSRNNSGGGGEVSPTCRLLSLLMESPQGRPAEAPESQQLVGEAPEALSELSLVLRPGLAEGALGAPPPPPDPGPLPPLPPLPPQPVRLSLERGRNTQTGGSGLSEGGGRLLQPPRWPGVLVTCEEGSAASAPADFPEVPRVGAASNHTPHLHTRPHTHPGRPRTSSSGQHPAVPSSPPLPPPPPLPDGPASASAAAPEAHGGGDGGGGGVGRDDGGDTALVTELSDDPLMLRPPPPIVVQRLQGGLRGPGSQRLRDDSPYGESGTPQKFDPMHRSPFGPGGGGGDGGGGGHHRRHHHHHGRGDTHLHGHNHNQHEHQHQHRHNNERHRNHNVNQGGDLGSDTGNEDQQQQHQQQSGRASPPLPPLPPLPPGRLPDQRNPGGPGAVEPEPEPEPEDGEMTDMASCRDDTSAVSLSADDADACSSVQQLSFTAAIVPDPRVGNTTGGGDGSSGGARPGPGVVRWNGDSPAAAAAAATDSPMARSTPSRYGLVRDITSTSLGLASEYAPSMAGGAAGAPSELDSGLQPTMVDRELASVPASPAPPPPLAQEEVSVSALAARGILSPSPAGPAGMVGHVMRGSPRGRVPQGQARPGLMDDDQREEGEEAAAVGAVWAAAAATALSPRRSAGPPAAHSSLRRRGSGGTGPPLLLHSLSGGVLESVDEAEGGSTDGQSSATAQGGSTGDLLGLPGGSNAAEQFMQALHPGLPGEGGVGAAAAAAVQDSRGGHGAAPVDSQISQLGSGRAGVQIGGLTHRQEEQRRRQTRHQEEQVEQQQGQQQGQAERDLEREERGVEGHAVAGAAARSGTGGGSLAAAPSQPQLQPQMQPQPEQHQGQQQQQQQQPQQPQQPHAAAPVGSAAGPPLAAAASRSPFLTLLRPVTAALVSAAVALAPPSRGGWVSVLERTDTVTAIPAPFNKAQGSPLDDGLSSMSAHSLAVAFSGCGSQALASPPMSALPSAVAAAPSLPPPPPPEPAPGGLHSEHTLPMTLPTATSGEVWRESSSSAGNQRPAAVAAADAAATTAATGSGGGLWALRQKALLWATRRNSPAAAADKSLPSDGRPGTSAGSSSVGVAELQVTTLAAAASGVDGDADDLVGERLAMILDGGSRRARASIDETFARAAAAERRRSMSLSRASGHAPTVAASLRSPLSREEVRGAPSRPRGAVSVGGAGSEAGLSAGMDGDGSEGVEAAQFGGPLSRGASASAGGAPGLPPPGLPLSRLSSRRSLVTAVGESGGGFGSVGHVGAGSGFSGGASGGGACGPAIDAFAGAMGRWSRHTFNDDADQPPGGRAHGGGIGDDEGGGGGEMLPFRDGSLSRQRQRHHHHHPGLLGGVDGYVGAGSREEGEEGAAEDEATSDHFVSQSSTELLMDGMLGGSEGPGVEMGMGMAMGMDMGMGMGIEMEEQEEVEVAVPATSTSQLVERWRAAQVRDWLVRIGHGGLADKFEEMGITGRALCGLMRVMRGGGGAAVVRDMLRDDLGVTGLAAQLELLEELHRLFD